MEGPEPHCIEDEEVNEKTLKLTLRISLPGLGEVAAKGAVYFLREYSGAR